ncbi:MAG: DUF2270 domain-containing protein [Desulfuromonadaceae bacterium]|nr:DUF2270 domain-containing protein [Desulfuromonadaceae bacterium]
MSEDKNERQPLTRVEMITAMAHYYRAEVSRSLAWRRRIDVTTNWAVGATAAFLGFSFSNPQLTHVFFIFALAITYTLLYVEGRRYRFYDAYEYRVKLIHQNFVYSILHGELDMGASAPWRQNLAEDLLHPGYKISLWVAMALRVKAYYVFLFLVLIAGWLFKIYIHPEIAGSWSQFLDNARLGNLSGWYTLIFLAFFFVHVFVLRAVGISAKGKGGRESLQIWPSSQSPAEHGEPAPLQAPPSPEGEAWPSQPPPVSSSEQKDD